MISPAFNSNSGGGLTITYEFPGLCSMSATKNKARKNCSIPRKWLVYFRCKVSSVFSTQTLKNTQQFGKKSLLFASKLNFIFDWQSISLIIPLIMWPPLLKHYPADTFCILRWGQIVANLIFALRVELFLGRILKNLLSVSLFTSLNSPWRRLFSFHINFFLVQYYSFFLAIF